MWAGSLVAGKAERTAGTMVAQMADRRGGSGRLTGGVVRWLSSWECSGLRSRLRARQGAGLLPLVLWTA